METEVRGREGPLKGLGEKPAKTTGEESHRECSLLVVDDEADTSAALAELLEEEGYSVQRASNGEEALALLHEGWVPALILLDLTMPVLDGRGFLKAVALEPDLAAIPVAIVTAAAVLDRLPSIRNDAGLFLKPIDTERLLRVVRRYCG
jgi:two-component system chemotaxis response regulator CheY